MMGKVDFKDPDKALENNLVKLKTLGAGEHKSIKWTLVLLEIH